MKAKNLSIFYLLVLVITFISKSFSQTTQATNAISAGSFLGTSNNQNVIFKMNNQFSGIVSNNSTSFGYLAFPPASSQPTECVAFGSYSLGAMLSNSGGYNTAIGFSALRNNIAGGNTAVGNKSMFSNTQATSNTALGYNSLFSIISGDNNVGIGRDVMYYKTSGSFNIAIGFQAQSNNNGSSNIGIGNGALGNSSASNNIGVGSNSLGTTSGASNIGLGNNSGGFLSSGSQNICIGQGHASYVNANAAMTGSGNVIIGNSINMNQNNSTFSLNNLNNNIILADGGFNKGSGSIRVLIDANGRAGLGTLTPNNKLEIKNDNTPNSSGLRFTNLTSASNVVANPSNPPKVLSVNANGDVILVNDATGTGTGTGGCNIYNCDDTIDTTTIGSPNPGLRTVTMGNNNLFFQTNTTNDGNGRVYIGSSIVNNGFSDGFPLISTDSRFRLLVEGGILTEKIKVALRSTTNWADYVFDSGYELKPLKEVETFIYENKHLPGISSANELVKDGLDLAEMQAKQMEKIEELTLYLIEQNKVLEKQSKQIEELKVKVDYLSLKK